MSRFFVLIPVMLWYAWVGTPTYPVMGGAAGSALFLAGLFALVGVMSLWGARVGRRGGFRAGRFLRAMATARLLMLAWFAAGLFYLGWGGAVTAAEGRWLPWPAGVAESPGLILGTLPVLLAWAGLVAARHPVERAARERSILERLDMGLPVYHSPGLGKYVGSNLRLGLGFTLAPILAVLLLRDIIRIGLWLHGTAPPAWFDAAATFGPVALVFVLAPELLRRVLPTRPLPAGRLRDRLEAMCARTGLRYRNILLWDTGHGMGNAAVMGVIPQVRYILLSDLLVETMSDRQIEAVFAHEVGHVRHRHMAWYVAFIAGLMLVLAGPGDWLSRAAMNISPAGEWVVSLGALGLGLLGFGLLSRRFERQADVFAARTMQAEIEPEVRPTYVGEGGASLFASALARVAQVNGIPLVARRSWADGRGLRFGYWLDLLADTTGNYLHGSLLSRIHRLRDMADEPGSTRRFDRKMRRVKWALVALLAIGGAGVAWASRP